MNLIMGNASAEKRYTPLVILALVGALVATLGFWARDRAAENQGSNRAAVGATGEHYQWKMITTWPKNFPGLGFAAENFSRAVEEMSNGRLTVHVYGAGEIVPALEVFDAVSQGVGHRITGREKCRRRSSLPRYLLGSMLKR
jgi:TRAP-type C4-dicarboxylate transport system substrate-binding protein